MDLAYYGRVLGRLKPFVRDQQIKRSRLERVLGTLKERPDIVRPEVERLLAQAGIAIDEDGGDATTPKAASASVAIGEQRPIRPTPPRARRGDASEKGAAIAAARQRMEADRAIKNLSRVLLTAQEEVGLTMLLRGRRGEALDQGGFATLTGEARAAAQTLFLHNQRLVHSIAQSYAPTGMEYEDVVQHGMTGLIRAVELFDPSAGNKFSTYATWWIRQSITRGIANDARLIRLPVHMVERINKVWAVRGRLTVDGEPPTLHALALSCELTDTQVRECLKIGRVDYTSLDAPVGQDGEMTLGDLLDRASPDDDPFAEVEAGLLQEQLHAVLDTLSEREATIIAMRFGLDDGEPKTLDQIGKYVGVTRERIRQLEGKTMTKLRHRSRSEVLRSYL